MAGCTISPLAFTMAMEIIIRASKWVVGGERLQCNQRDVVGQVQHRGQGSDSSPKTPPWHKATSAQKRQLVVEEIRGQEEGERYAKAVSMAKQGEKDQLGGPGEKKKKKLSWRDIWQMTERVELYHQSHIRPATLPPKSERMVWRRSCLFPV
ncbi:hypothetical protein QQF64_025986 [Cirrhinus molitorella]|uniref:Uncharacterized protein n=1 Tax=Cirrhinus molitorella TaxID=172907 RepID=A0ABR3NQK9_9TELE